MQDKFGLIPPHIKQNYEREEMVDRQIEKASALYQALREMDDRLDLVFISDRADPEYGVVPGRWHVVRRNPPPAPESYIPIVTESGGYREPDSGVLYEMQRRDLWKHGIPKADLKPSAEREGEADEAMIDEIVSDIKAGARVPGDNGLNKRLWGRK